jgi:formylglycine-generating enzyme required for sulfatase activity
MGRATTGPENDVCNTWANGGYCSKQEVPEHDATVSGFSLDTYEVTAGRFRRFVAGYPANKPAAGEGAHPHIPGSGWQSAWDASLATDQAALIAELKCESKLQTWTDVAGANENKPINCVNWRTAFAFCAWEGGRLPTEAEWEYAAAGGSENRVVPWGDTAPDQTLANYGCLAGTGSTCSADALHTVGSTPLGASRWGQQDLAGSLREWTRDTTLTAYSSASIVDYANLAWNDDVMTRGGSFEDSAARLRAVARASDAGTGLKAYYVGVRCAHSP